MFDNPTDNHTDIEVPLYYKLRFTKLKKGVSQNGQTPSIIGICSYCVLDRPVFERCQTLLHPELTPWWSFLLADGVSHSELILTLVMNLEERYLCAITEIKHYASEIRTLFQTIST